MEETNEEIKENAQNGAQEEALTKVKRRPKIFTADGMSIIVTVVFFLILLANVIIGLLNPVLKWYGEAQGVLVITQNLRSMLLILIPLVLEKIFGVKVDYKILFFLYLFGFSATVLGESCRFYYDVPGWDKVLHAISGCMQVYIVFGFAQAMMKSSTSKYKFWFALFFAFLGSMAVAALWEILEFSSDQLLGTDMQKTMPFRDAFGDWNTKHDLGASIEQIGEFYKSPAGYRMGIMDSMTDIVWCLVASVAFVVVMAVIYLIKKDFFKDSVKYSPDYRFGFIRKLAKKRAANAVADTDADGEVAASEEDKLPENEVSSEDNKE